MGFIKFIRHFFGIERPGNKAPFVLISKDSDIVEYNNIEAAIADLEKVPSILKEKIEKIRASFEVLKNKGKIKIKNGEIIE